MLFYSLRKNLEGKTWLYAVSGATYPEVEEAYLPTLGWGKQSIWLAASGRQTPFRAEARTHFVP